VKFGGREYSCAFVRDISERVRADQALQQSEERFRAIFETADDFIFVKDTSHRFILANPAMARLFGLPVSQIVGHTSEEVFGAEVAERIQEVDSRVLRGETVIGETSLTTRGTSKVFHIIRVPMRDSSGAVIGLMGIARDITERKQMEEALRESEERFRLIADTIEDMFWITDWADRRTIFASQAYEKIWGRTIQSLYANPTDWADAIHPDDRQRAWEVFQGMEEGDRYDQEYRVVRPDGSIRWVHDRGFSICDKSGQVDRVVGISQDITERKRAEEERRRLEAQMQHAQKLESLGVLAGGIAHDFNNLLVAILGNADLALMELSPASPAWESIEDIRIAARRAAELSKQMLAYSGKGRFVIEALNLSEVVEEMAHLLEVSISKRAILKDNFADNLPAIEADAAQVRQIILNLITNASEAIGDRSGVISISTGAMECDRAYLSETYLDEDLPEGLYVYLEVADTGCGMDEETQAKVFDPFFTTKFTGRGLGLAAVLGIVRGHGGAIKVYSELGRGTTFKVLFPASEAERVALVEAEGRDALESWRGSGTILVVDDEETVSTMAKRMLEWMGFDVLTAGDGREALEIFRDHTDEIDCILLDLTMPGMDGEQAFRELRRIRSNVRVVMCSGYNEQEVTQRFAGKGLTGFIQKPFQLDGLAEKMREVLEGQKGSS